MNTSIKPHISFWLIAVLALLWNGLACVNFIVQMNPEMVANAPASHQAIIVDRPLWATAGFGIGVFIATLAAVIMMLKKRQAVALFSVSLIGIFVTTLHTLKVAGSISDFGFENTFVMAWLPVTVGVFLIWYAIVAKGKGWLI